LVSGNSWELYLHRSQRVEYQQRGLRTTAGGTERATRANLRAALGFLQLPPRAPELLLLHQWLDSWTGVGLIAVGLHRQGWDLQLTQYGDGNWRATFYVTGAAHSIVGGSAWETTPWRAVQRAAWVVVDKDTK
jgi:hypothetical protein